MASPTRARLARSSVAVLSLAATLLASEAGRAEARSTSPVVELLEPFLAALLIEDFARSAKATLPFVHRSLKNAQGDDLHADLKRYSFKKAHDNAAHYKRPVEVVHVGATAITGIGAHDAFEAGIVVDYFIRRRGSDVAPVRIFFPQGGGAPTIAYMGSL